MAKYIYKMSDMSETSDMLLVDKHILPDIFKQYSTPDAAYVIFERSRLEKIVTKDQMDKVVDYQETIFKYLYYTFRNVDDASRDKMVHTEFNLQDLPDKFKINFEIVMRNREGEPDETTSRFYGQFRQYKCIRDDDRQMWIIDGEAPLELEQILHDDPLLAGPVENNCYHIQTVEGLNRFVELVDQFYLDRPIKKMKR